MPKVVTVGGGSGQSVLLKGLVNVLPQAVELGAIVTSSDSGGSTGELRDQFGVLPVGDLRRCITALAQTQNPILRRVLLDEERPTGHPMLNFALAHHVSGNRGEIKARLKDIQDLLETRGYAWPVTLCPVDLKATFENGEPVIGEHLIDTGDHAGKGRIIKLELLHSENEHNHSHKKGKKKIFGAARGEILSADFVVVSPGDLYTSIIPNVLVSKMKAALQNSGCKLVFVVNVMSKRAETFKYKAHEFVREFEKYAGKKVDVVICNNVRPARSVLKRYEKEGKHFVEPIKVSSWDGRRVVSRDLIVFDDDHRIRHDGDKLAALIYQIMCGVA